MNEKYKNIINLPHKSSTKHPPMSRMDRAAQFAPYSALSGYEDAVEETARLTDKKIELDEGEKEKINATLVSLINSESLPRVVITYFRPDHRKIGGAYITAHGEVGSIDTTASTITLIGGKTIYFSDIFEIYKIDEKDETI